MINIICDGVALEFANSLETGRPTQCKHTGQGFVQITNCDIGTVKRMPKLEIQIDSHIYQVRAQNYLRQVTPTPVIIFEENKRGYKLSDYCTFRVFPTQKKEWILGQPFLADFYQVYTLDRK